MVFHCEGTFRDSRADSVQEWKELEREKTTQGESLTLVKTLIIAVMS